MEAVWYLLGGVFVLTLLLVISMQMEKLRLLKSELSLREEIQFILNSPGPLCGKLDEISDVFSRLMKTKWCFIFLWDEKSKRLVKKIAKGIIMSESSPYQKVLIKEDESSQIPFEPLMAISFQECYRNFGVIKQGDVRFLSIPLPGQEDFLNGVIHLGPITSRHSSLIKRYRKILLAMSRLISQFCEQEGRIDAVKKRVAELETLQELNKTMLITSMELKTFLELILRLAIKNTQSKGGFIYLPDQDCLIENNLSPSLSKELIERLKTRPFTKELIASSVSKLLKEKAGKFALLPLQLKTGLSPRGVLGVVSGGKGTFEPHALRLLKLLAQRTTLSLANVQLFNSMFEKYRQTLVDLAESMDLRQPFSIGHSDRIVKYAVQTAKEMGINSRTIEGISLAAKLHDIGMCGIAEEICLKPGKFTDYEYNTMKHHPQIGEALVDPIKYPLGIPPIVRFHHERYDGLGYPDGLRAEDIPIGARIIAVADTFEAKTSNRNYRPALPFGVAIEQIKEGSGTQFDPNVVKAFLSWIKKRQSQAPPDRSLERCYEMKRCPEDIKTKCTCVRSNRNCWEVEGRMCKLHGDSDCRTCLVYTEWITRRRNLAFEYEKINPR